MAGVGAKTAQALLGAYDDLDAVYADLDGVAELPIRGARSLAKKLEAQREMAFLSRELATVAYDAPATAKLRELAWTGADEALLDPLLDELGFGRIRERISRWRTPSRRQARRALCKRDPGASGCRYPGRYG